VSLVNTGDTIRAVSECADAVVVGAGHNGLVAATLLARAGWSVRVLERSDHVGGAAVSEQLFPGVDAQMSRYSYLVSLFPSGLLAELGVTVERRPRTVPDHRSPELVAWHARMARLAERVAPTLTEPLRTREQLRALVDDEQIWEDIFERPLSVAIERDLHDDVERGAVLTDALIGTFAAAGEPALRQNRCFLYHVIGDGHGRWDVPVGGIGAITDQLAKLARAAGAEIEMNAPVTRIDSDGTTAEVTCEDGSRQRAKHVLLNADLGRSCDREGSQLKINMLLRRLPRPRAGALTAELAFRGTFHVNEGYAQLQTAYEQARSGRIPSLPPCEVYCHSLTDASVLCPELQAAGAQTLTLFGLHMPARLFRGPRHEDAKRAAVSATLDSLNSALAEPIEPLLWIDARGAPCIDALTPVELEALLGLPGGHIFHRDLQWPFAERPDQVGRWGVETEHANVWICGAGARRGGGVSGIPGHNAARAVLARGTSVDLKRD
jgi:phytoene dehydrogenase-like protein